MHMVAYKCQLGKIRKVIASKRSVYESRYFCRRCDRNTGAHPRGLDCRRCRRFAADSQKRDNAPQGTWLVLGAPHGCGVGKFVFYSRATRVGRMEPNSPAVSFHSMHPGCGYLGGPGRQNENPCGHDGGYLRVRTDPDRGPHPSTRPHDASNVTGLTSHQRQ